MALWNEITSRFRSLGFGAFLGGGLLGLIYILFPFVFPPSISINIVLTVGGFLGAGFHKMLGRIFDVVFGGSLTKHTEYYLKLIKLFSVRKIIGVDRFNAAVGVLAITDVLDGKVSQKLLEEMQRSVARQLPATTIGNQGTGGESVDLAQLTQFMQTYYDFQKKLNGSENLKSSQVEKENEVRLPTPH